MIAEKFQSLIRTSQSQRLLHINRQLQMIHDRGARRQHLRSRRFPQSTKIICIVDNLRTKPLGMTQLFPTQYETAHEKYGLEEQTPSSAC